MKFAANGVYTWDEIKEIPMSLLSNYWVRGTGDISKFAKIKDSARKACQFKAANLMETQALLKLGAFDIIFCRNVFIYFQHDDVLRIAGALSSQLKTNGYMFLGLPESLSNPPGKLKKCGPSIYGPPANISNEKAVVEKKSDTPKPNIRVVCVDDSNTILSMMKAILKPEFGFEIVATASNGSEAQALLKTGIKFDVMTLDVHMPVMTGIEYLRENFLSSHPPVVMLTSASRDNMDLAHEAVKLGAKDYIEKPSLNELTVKSDEIRSKLRSLVGDKIRPLPSKVDSASFTNQFQTSMVVKQTLNKVNVICLNDSRCDDLMTLLRDPSFTRFPCVVLSFGDLKCAQKIRERLMTESVSKSKMLSLTGGLQEGKIYFCDIGAFRESVAAKLNGKAICYSVLSNMSRAQWEQCVKSQRLKILLLENVDRSVFLSQLPSLFVSPITSFAYTANEFFGRIDLKSAG